MFSSALLLTNIPALSASDNITSGKPDPYQKYQLTKILLTDSSKIKINKQADLLTDFTNNLILLQSDNNRVIKLSSDGKILKEYGGFGFGIGQFNKPIAVASSDGGLNLNILDSENRRIVRLSSSLNWIDQTPVDFGGDDESLGELSGFAVNSTGEFYVSDPRNSRILKFDQFGEFQLQLRTRGEFFTPAKLALDNRDYLYVCDINRGNIVVFDDLDNFVSVFGKGVLKSPDMIYADNSRIYVGDQSTGSVYVFNLNYEVVAIIKGDTPDNENRQFPTAITVSSTGSLWIADHSSNRIYRYDPVEE